MTERPVTKRNVWDAMPQSTLPMFRRNYPKNSVPGSRLSSIAYGFVCIVPYRTEALLLGLR
jgi:hypothetical protein